MLFSCLVPVPGAVVAGGGENSDCGVCGWYSSAPKTVSITMNSRITDGQTLVRIDGGDCTSN